MGTLLDSKGFLGIQGYLHSSTICLVEGVMAECSPLGSGSELSLAEALGELIHRNFARLQVFFHFQ